MKIRLRTSVILESAEEGWAYLMLVEQLRICLKELRTLEKASLVDEARSMLNKLLATQ